MTASMDQQASEASRKIELKDLSMADKRACNKMADIMDRFHSHFRQEWNVIFAAVGPSPKPSEKLSTSQLFRTVNQFISHLTMHHNIEEEYIFPILAKRMPEFRDQGRDAEGPINDHKVIHAGLDKMEAYISQCKSGERALRREELKDIMDSFGSTLWRHLEEEVQMLGYENMTKYWTKSEIQNMPI